MIIQTRAIFNNATTRAHNSQSCFEFNIKWNAMYSYIPERGTDVFGCDARRGRVSAERNKQVAKLNANNSTRKLTVVASKRLA